MKCIFGKIIGVGTGAGTSPAHTDAGAGTDVGAGTSTARTAQMILNDYGNVAYNEWVNLHKRFENLELDVFQIMPNHMHGIIIINEKIERISIGNIVGAYKSLVDRGCRKIAGAGTSPAHTDVGAGFIPARIIKIWHRNYYEHIIRNEESYYKIAEYIINNPTNWRKDKYYY
jgi:REP element-mobilizing transposase RayT